VRRLEADVGEAMRSLKGAQGDEEALRNKAMHLRDEIDRAEVARDKALAAHDKALAVSSFHRSPLYKQSLSIACKAGVACKPAFLCWIGLTCSSMGTSYLQSCSVLRGTFEPLK